MQFKMRFSIDKNASFLALTIFGTNLMACVFEFYYVKLFLDVYHISQGWFHFAQVVYLIWNAVNDPLFAYWQDNSNMVVFRSRRHSIMYGAPLFALSFLLFWFPWREYSDHDWLCGLHLTVALCCYDCLFTFVLLAHCALFAEISTDLDYRLMITRYCKIASVLASLVLTVIQFVSNGLEEYRYFQACCVCIAFFAWLSMYLTGKHVRTHPNYSYTKIVSQKNLQELAESEVKVESSLSHPFQQWRQLMTTDFVAFVSTNFLQVLHMTYGASFMVIFGDQLIPKGEIPDVMRKLMYGSSAVLPTVAVLVLSLVVSSYGYHWVIKWTYITNIIIALVMYSAGPSHTWMLVTFLLVDRCISTFVFGFFNLPLSDIIDKDQETYERTAPLSSSVFGYNALFTKPAQSIAPMVVVAILNGYGYEKLKHEELDDAQIQTLTNVMFNIVCLFPVGLSLLRIYTWSKYNIRNTHTKVAKHIET